jgi:hypothetical protein
MDEVGWTMMLEKNIFLSIARKEYKKRLFEALSEVDMFDKEGNPIVSKDLKVTHKDSGYEYTIDRVMDKRIVLRSPETPRFDAPGEEEILGAPPVESQQLDEDDDDVSIPQKTLPPQIPTDAQAVTVQDTITPGEEEEEILFVIDQEEFEKEYEVK